MRLTALAETGTGWLITQRSQVQILSPLLKSGLDQAKRPSEGSPGAVFMRLGNGCVNIS
jgi:hypothetical protein